MDRREFCAVATAAAFSVYGAATGASRSQKLGDRLYADVVRYSGLGEHRTAGRADHASTAWLGNRLRASGYDVTTPGFEVATFDVDQASLSLDNLRIDAFPAWPVVSTPGTTGSLRDASTPGDLTGSVALVVLPYRPGSAFIVPGFGSAVASAQSRGAAAVVIVTEGPTGEIIALNAHLERYAWRVPVVLVAGRQAARLRAMAISGSQATVRILGTPRPRAQATNVFATRPALKGAPAGTVVLTTPKSGWFTCAGERGTGIALFLAMADLVARASRRSLVAVATSGHELEGLGGEALLAHHAPPPAEVALWVHLGANLASNVVDLTAGVRRTTEIHGNRGILVPASQMPAAARAFADQPGYRTPVDILSNRAVGEVVIYRRDGYRNLVGLVGGHPLHHTRLDTPGNATSPETIEPVARGLGEFLRPLV